MTRAERAALRAQVQSKDWECSAELLISLLDELDSKDEEIARLNDIIRRLAREDGK